MAKEAYYFRHDYNARTDDKILELRASFGAEGYGLFWMIIESMAENEDGGLKASLLGGLAIGFGTTKERLTELMNVAVSIGLFYKEEDKYFSKRLLNHKDFRKFLSEKGREGARIREENKHRMKGGLYNPSTKERKGKEIYKGIEILPEKSAVVFPDGTEQQLGKGQKELFDMGKLKPHDVTKGLIN